MNSPLFAELVRETWAMEPRALEGFLQTVAGMDPAKRHAWGYMQDLKWVAELRGDSSNDVPRQQLCGLDHEGGKFTTKVGTEFKAIIDHSTEPITGNLNPDVDARRAPRGLFHRIQGSLSENLARSEGGPFDEAPRRSRLSVAEGVGTIQISGVLLKRVPNIARWFGVEATGYSEIQSDLAQAMGADNVKSIRLRIESPGGMVSGVKETADAIYQAATKKDVAAEIVDMGASAALWLASQADSITANPNASVGSLGAYTAYADYSKMAEAEGIKIHVVASGPHKGMGVPGAPITEAQLGPVQKLIDGIAGQFHADLSRGRGMDAQKTKPWMTGEVWRAEEAVTMGVIDGIKSYKETSSPGGPAAADTPQGEVETMATETEKAAAEDKIRSEAAGAERKRLTDLKAAFPGEEKFVMEQFEAGASVEKAEAAFSKVLKVRLAAKDAELVEAKKAPAKPAGAAPLPVGGDPGASEAGPGFMAAAKAYAKENDCSMREAFSAVARQDKAAFEKHTQAAIDAAPAHSARKKELGVS